MVTAVTHRASDSTRFVRLCLFAIANRNSLSDDVRDGPNDLYLPTSLPSSIRIHAYGRICAPSRSSGASNVFSRATRRTLVGLACAASWMHSPLTRPAEQHGTAPAQTSLCSSWGESGATCAPRNHALTRLGATTPVGQDEHHHIGLGRASRAFCEDAFCAGV